MAWIGKLAQMERLLSVRDGSSHFSCIPLLVCLLLKLCNWLDSGTNFGSSEDWLPIFVRNFAWASLHIFFSKKVRDWQRALLQSFWQGLDSPSNPWHSCNIRVILGNSNSTLDNWFEKYFQLKCVKYFHKKNVSLNSAGWKKPLIFC